MDLLGHTIVDFVTQNLRTGKGTQKYILPSYSPRLLFEIGEAIEEIRLRSNMEDMLFKYGIAFRLGEEWQNGANSEDLTLFNNIVERGWYNHGNNLTSLRNGVKPDGKRLMIVMLAGYEHIDDQASLQDFFHLDESHIWNLCMKKSFKSWIQEKIPRFSSNKELVNQLDKCFISLMDHGRTDLAQMSLFLESANWDAAYDGNEVLELFLENLDSFNLPCMSGLARKRGVMQFNKYLGVALEVFDYSRFRDAGKRKKALDQIAKYKDADSRQELDPEDLGEFESSEELLDALEAYIEGQTQQDRNDLMKADFVAIHDKVLGFKSNKKDSDSKPKASKERNLNGLPVEVVLRALWLSLGEYKRDVQKRMAIACDELDFVELSSICLKYEFDEEEENSSEYARTWLEQLLGGIDDYLQEHIDLNCYGEDYADGGVKVVSRLSPQVCGDELQVRKSGQAEPGLYFRVVIRSKSIPEFSRDFKWVLPMNHEVRIMMHLYYWVFESYIAAKGRITLPVGSLPHFPEIFQARDKDEVNRLLTHAIGSQNRQIVNLYNERSMREDPLKEDLDLLSYHYERFIKAAYQDGFFAAMNRTFSDLQKAYANCCTRFFSCGHHSEAGPILLKAFMLANQEETNRNDSWIYNDFMPDAIVTPLHPALLEMMMYQHTYLCNGFNHKAVRALKELGDKAFTEAIWSRFVDMASIKWPINGILRDSNSLDTQVVHFDYVHLLGCPEQTPSFVTSRLLTQIIDDEDEEITSGDLFRYSQCAQLVEKVLYDFVKLNTYSEDGISVAIYAGLDIQPFIAGLDGFLKRVIPDDHDSMYSLDLTIYSNTTDDSAVMRWINAWKLRWQQAVADSAMEYYNQCRISIKYRIVVKDTGNQHFQSLIKQSEYDIIFFSDFIESGISKFIEFRYDPSQIGYTRFPILEKTRCSIRDAGLNMKRERIISNPRFKLGHLHTEVMVHLRNESNAQNPEIRHIVQQSSDFQPWVSLVDEAHRHSTWVVLIDPSVDERLLKSDGVSKRDIIGFGTGVGSHGENNYTISTEQYSFYDIQNKIKYEVQSELSMTSADAELIARNLVSEAQSIAGLSLINATGPSRYVHELVCNAVVRKSLPSDCEALCDVMITLDAFSHWFINPYDRKRPDLLRIQAYVSNERIRIHAQLIECKLRLQSFANVQEAIEQLESGLFQLVRHFKPLNEDDSKQMETDPEQRYWWMQLHRLIASMSEVSKGEANEVLLALEHLSEGNFAICWEAAVVAIWKDILNAEINSHLESEYICDDVRIPIFVAEAGVPYIKAVCLNEATGCIFPVLNEFSPEDRSKDLAVETAKPRRETQVNSVDNSNSLTPIEPERDKSQQGVVSGVASHAASKNQTADVDSRQLSRRILLGHMIPNGREVYWEIEAVNNRHLLVFGSSGSGKTYTIQCILFEMALNGQNSLIVDYTSGFTNAQLNSLFENSLNPTQHYIRREPLPLNPFRQQREVIDGMDFLEDATTTAHRVSDVFSSVYQFGAQQKSALYNSIRSGIKEQSVRGGFNLTSLMTKLEELREKGGPTGNSSATVISKIEPFVDLDPFGFENPESWEQFYTDAQSRCHIIQLAGFVTDSARLITEFSLFDLYWYYRANGRESQPKVIVLDEVQNLDHRLESPLGRMLTEGRKFGISLILATQTLSNLGREEQDRLFQASHKLFFKPAETEVRKFAQVLSDATSEKNEVWISRLNALQQGECYSLGPIVHENSGKVEGGKALKVHVQSLEHRISKMGE